MGQYLVMFAFPTLVVKAYRIHISTYPYGYIAFKLLEYSVTKMGEQQRLEIHILVSFYNISTYTNIL